MSKEVKELFISIFVLIVQIVLLVLVSKGNFPQPGYGIIAAIFVVLIAYFAYQTIRKAAAVVNIKKDA